MKVIVLGSGIIGVTTAYFLAKDGHEVTVLEKNSASALSCSYANGGQLSYSHIEPWASKASVISAIKSRFHTSSFLAIPNFLVTLFNREFWKWSFSFLRNSTDKRNKENSKKTFALGLHSKKAFTEIFQEEGDLKFDYKSEGILHFFRSEKSFESAIKKAEFHNSIGCKAQILSKSECIEKEPTLVKLYDENKLAGGVFYEMDASGNSFLFAQSLEKICREKYGVIFEYNTEISNILTNHKKITGINTDKGVFVADKYVSALGAFSNKLLKGIKIDSKIYPLKGYSLSIFANEEFIAPKLSLTDSENKVVYSRIGGVFRAAGTVEICGSKSKKNKKLIKFLKTNIRASFSDFGDLNKVSEWFGFRPFRPNSIPLICQVRKYENFFINSGHGSLGWTLSAGSAKIIADLILNKKNEELLFLEEEERLIYRG
jgi:D-amino-acid dehydrogenase